MSDANIFFTLEEDNEEINQPDNHNVPCFCQGDIICVFCIKEKEDEVKENSDFTFLEFNIDDELFSKKVNYQVNYTVKQLLMICDYYGLLKGLKGRSKNKNELIELLVEFENNLTNSDIIYQRKKLWFYLEELKKDAFMKKYIWTNF